MSLTLGSLFDGSGGFPLAGYLCGIIPAWASEIEPYPIAVTKSRFPDMKHLGDISKINGATIEPVDVITFGSPCQDLSVAGKRAGLKHMGKGDEITTRSGLFMEAIRIIKEMRLATNGNYPRFAIFENVTGAFSSNCGEDFRIVLEEFIKIAEAEATVPPPPKGGWPYADAFVGDGWSLAYRTFDTQYWGKTIRDRDSGIVLYPGTPQRRRRLYLIADFAGKCAPGILFERESLQGDPAKSPSTWQSASASAGRRAETDDRERGTSVSPHTASVDDYRNNATQQFLFENHWLDGRCTGPLNTCTTLTSMLGTGGNNTPFVLKEQKFPNENLPVIPIHDKATRYKGGRPTRKNDGAGNGLGVGTPKDPSPTLSTCDRHAVMVPITDHIVLENQGGSQIGVRCDGKSPTIRGEMHGNVPYVLKIAGFKAGNGEKAKGIGWQEEISPTLAGAPSGTNQTPSICIAFAQNQRNELRDLKGVAGAIAAQPGVKQQTYICEPGCMATGQQKAKTAKHFSSALKCDHEQQIVFEGYQFGGYREGCGSLRSSGGDYGGGSENIVVERDVHYIVRRLTPIECARLQGFPDFWGYPDPKNNLTEEEFAFWLDVRNTHAEINGKTVRDYSKAQMLRWYQKLHSKSAEFKMWGNGVALPPTLFCMQGIALCLMYSGLEFSDAKPQLK